MKITPTPIDGLVVVEPKVFGDNRGYFFESYNRKNFAENGITADFMQDNESKSRYGVLRGLHYQAAPYTQAKLVRVMEGKVLDVAVDIRKNSKTFGQYFAIELSGENKLQLFVPRGFAHGFAVLSEEVVFAYKCDNFYMPSHERGIAFNDPDLNINWQIPLDKAILSAKDTVNPRLKDAVVFDLLNPDYL